MKKTNFNKSQLLRGQIYEYLRSILRSDNYKPGTSISINKMAEQLNVSRTPMREALIQLETEGFVTILPQRGVQVNLLELRDVLNIYEILGGLESRVIISVFEKLGQKEIDEMERLNDEMKSSFSDNKLEYYYNCNIDFHNVFLDLSENEELLKSIRILKQRLYDLYLVNYGNNWKKSNLKEHLKFINLLKKGDAIGAANYWRDEHWVFQFPEIFKSEV